MKATELRIGNYVNHNKFGLSEVVEVLRWGLSIKLQSENFNHTHNGEKNYHFEPIPLTEEWLLRFGFVSVVSDCFFLDIKDKSLDEPFIYINNNCTDTGFAINGGTDSTNIDIEIKYVHQLQNLYFALTGEELTLTASTPQT